ncbi:MAG: hypothetical protein AAFY09_15480 [Pseudomonadota bacterium]
MKLLKFVPFARKFAKDERGDLPQTLLIIGMIALPVALMLSNVGNSTADTTEERVDQLLDNGNDLQAKGN